MNRFIAAAALLLLVGCATTEVTDNTINAAIESVDYGDFSSQTLLSKAWKALEKKAYSDVFAYTRKCVELYGEQGKQMNEALERFAPEHLAKDHWALNDVGTCLFIMANAYETLEMYPNASKTYRLLAEDYTYAQTWDPKGWYWRPSESAAYKADKYKNW